MRFQDQPVIPLTRIFRAANCSTTMGNRVAEHLEKEGEIEITRLPSGRAEVTPPHGEVLYNAITGQ